MSEKCDRCGSSGEDRRTLHMACFYAMEELGPPFGREVLFHADPAECAPARAAVRAGDLAGGQALPDEARGIVLEAGTVRCAGELTPQRLYTLTVCKRCRGEWLAAIRDWFRAPPAGRDYDADEPGPPECGSGIFVRANGALKEISREEWEGGR